MDPKVLKLLAKTYLFRTMCGSYPTIPVGDLTEDGRKKKSVVAQLAKDGYIAQHASRETAMITPKACDELELEQPDLVAYYTGTEMPGIPFSRLTLAEQAWVWLHQMRYTFSNWDSSRRASSPLNIACPSEVLGPLYESRNTACLCVADTAMTEARRQRLFQEKLEKLRGESLAWGLVKAGLLSEHQAAQVKISAPTVFGDSIHFSPNPAKWIEELPVLVSRLATRMRGDTNLHATLLDLDAAIQRYGGWPKFLENYEANLIVDIRKSEEPEPTLSTEIEWKLEEEQFHFMAATFDIAKAKKTLSLVPHKIEKVNLIDAKRFLGMIKTYPEKMKNADFRVPVILADIGVGMLPIDGWNRIAQALHRGKTELPCCALTEEETKACRL